MPITLNAGQANAVDLTQDESAALPAASATGWLRVYLRSNSGEHTLTVTGAVGGDVTITDVNKPCEFVPYDTGDGSYVWDLQSFEGPAGPQGDTGPQGLQGETGPQGPQGVPGDTSNMSLTGLDFDSAVADDAVASASQTVNLDRTTGKLSYDFEITQATTLTYTNGEKSQGGEDTIWNDSGSTQTVTIAVGTGLTRLLGTPPTEIANNKKLVISRRVIANTPGSGLALFVNFQEADI